MAAYDAIIATSAVIATAEEQRLYIAQQRAEVSRTLRNTLQMNYDDVIILSAIQLCCNPVELQMMGVNLR